MKGWNLWLKLGLLLMIVSCGVLLGSELLAIRNRNAARDLARQMKNGFSQRSEGNPEHYSDPAMPVMQLEGEDFIALLEVPAFGVALPVGSSWNRTSVSRYPCCFWGSAYDASLILGGSSRTGQFDFCSRLDPGESILVTDMAGGQFSYVVARIDRRKHADLAALQTADSDLTLFCRDGSSLDYIIVRCVSAPYLQA